MRKIAFILALLVTLVFSNTKANADNSIAVYQVLYGYLFEDGSFDAWCSVPGVAINNKTLLAVFNPYSTENYSEIIKERYEGYSTLGIDLNEITELQCVVYDGNETLITASTEFTDDGYVIVSTDSELEKVSHFSSDTYSDVSECNAVGLPQSLMDLCHYTSEDDILFLTIEDTYKYTDSFELSSDNSIICVTDRNNGILGIVIGRENGKYKVIEGSSIKESLTVRYIGFNVEENSVKNTEAIEDAIKQAEEISSQNYTDESYQKLQKEVEVAKTVLETGTQPEIDRETRVLLKAISDLEEKKANVLIIVLVIIVLLLITGGIVFVFIKFVFKPKKPTVKTNIVKEEHEIETPAINRNIKALPPPSPNINYNQSQSYDPTGTSVLTSSSEASYIERMLTGEIVKIETFPFTIGKDRDSATYCIYDNDTISRIHCIIVCMNGEFNVMDNNSTNGTYVDGYKIAPLIAFPLRNGAAIMISNETLIFHTR